MKTKVIFLLLVLLYITKHQAQKNSITTALPFLLITSDAKSGGMGDVGVGTSSDAFSLFHNPSKIAFNEKKFSIGISYAPWLRNLTDDVFAGNISVINKINTNAAWGVDLKLFSLGKIDLTNNTGIPAGYKNPNELAFSGYYAMKLSERFSMSVGLKYLNSNLDISDTFKAISSFAVDVSAYYQSEEENYGTFNGRYRLGMNITNIGPKVEYIPGEQSFIPTNMKLGGGFDFIFGNANFLGLNVEFRKLLVPSSGGASKEGWFSGMFSSFSDRAFSEELREIAWAFGAEYSYNKSFTVRTGYFHENKTKGNRQFFTLGTGFKTNKIHLNLSYLINSSNVNNPLENTLRFSLAFDLGKTYNYY